MAAPLDRVFRKRYRNIFGPQTPNCNENVLKPVTASIRALAVITTSVCRLDGGVPLTSLPTH